jgi:hypothetical protein
MRRKPKKEETPKDGTDYNANSGRGELQFLEDGFMVLVYGLGGLIVGFFEAIGRALAGPKAK